MTKKLTFIFLASFTFAFGNAYAQTPDTFSRINQFIEQNIEKSHIPGLSIAIVDKNKVIFSKGYGKDGNNRAISSNSPFAIASLSKAFTAMAVMQLVEAGKLNLDSPIKKYIPSFKMADSRADQITVRQFLNQTSGLSDMVYPELTFKQQPASLENTIENLKDVVLAGNPGEKFRYHNPNYHVAARLVEVASQEKFSAYLQKHIFAPLQMTHSSNHHSTLEFRKNLPQGNIFLFGQPLAIDEPNWFIEGSAGMISTTSDLAKWLIMYMNKGTYNGQKLLSEQGIETMITKPASSSYGLGWFVDEQKNISHSGVLWTYQAQQMILTKEGYGIVILFNSGINAFQDYHSFLKGVAEILTNQELTLPFLPNSFYEMLLFAFIIITLGLTVMRFRNLRMWAIKHKAKPSWVVISKSIVRLIPIALFVSAPSILALISQRALSWERIFLMVPSGMIWLGVVGICNLLIVAARIIQLNKRLF